MDGRPAKQRLVELNVGEVSLVDQPANEEPFLVVKSEDGTMATKPDQKAAPAEPKTEETKPAAAESDDEDTALLAEVEKASQSIVAALEKRKGKPPFPPKPAAEGDDTEEDDASMKDGKKRKNSLRKGIHNLMEHIKGLMDQYGSESEDKPARKSVEADEEQEGLSLTVGKDGKMVIKGKAFGNQRIAKLKDALAPLLELLKEVDPEGFGALLTSGAMKPAGGELPGPTTQSMLPSVQKGLDEKLDKIMEAVGSVSKRVEAVEKSQAVTKSLPEGDTADPKKQVEKGKSIWTGVV